MTIIYASLDTETPVALLPVWFDDGALRKDTISTTDSVLISQLVGAIENLPMYKKNVRHIDARGKIVFSFDKGNDWVGYFDRFLLQVNREKIGYKFTMKFRNALNAIAVENKKRPVFPKKWMNIRYDDD